MTQEKKINVNQINYMVYETLIRACFADYTNSFNQVNPERRVVFNMTIVPATIKTHDVLKNQGMSEEDIKKYDNEKIEVRYLRVGKAFEKVKFHTPIIEEFKKDFIYQKVNVVDKVWEELKFEEGDTPPTQEVLDKGEIRVAVSSREKEIAIYQQSIRLKSKKEALNDKWWKRVLYLDLLNTLMAKGIEYGEVLELVKRGEQEKSVLAKELGDSAKDILAANNITIHKAMPAAMSKEDKAYADHVAKARAKEEKNRKK